MCGRIAPEQVYYYLSKLRASSKNEITLLKFIAANDEEKVGYNSFFNYLKERNRFGVIGNSGKAIKDFYIFPLPEDQEVHQSLLPFDCIGLEKKNCRPNYLIGILVRARKQQNSSTDYHPHSRLDHSDKSIHYSPDANFNTKLNLTPSTPPLNDDFNFNNNSNNSNKSQKRSYTPPPIFNTNSRSVSDNSNDEHISYTPPRRETEDDKDEPYDPEESLDFKSIRFQSKRQKIEHHRHHHHSSSKKNRASSISGSSSSLQIEQKQQSEKDEIQIQKDKDNNEKLKAAKSSPTKNLANLLEHLSKNSKLFENKITSRIMSEIAKTSSSEQQLQLLEELKRKREETEKQLEIKRKATENTFNQATSGKFDLNCIPGLDLVPGLDGDFSSLNEAKEDTTTSFLLPKDLEIPDSLKELLEKYRNYDDLNKSGMCVLFIFKFLNHLIDYTTIFSLLRYYF